MVLACSSLNTVAGRLLTGQGLRWSWRLLAVLLGSLHAWAAVASQSMNADGISYLDIGDAYWRGDWGLAVNAVWSPLYSWILGLALRLARPVPAWEFPLVHLVNLAIYLGVLYCFERFWQQIWILHQERRPTQRLGWPRWAWESLGYLLFIFTTLNLIELWSVTPDLLMAGLVLLAAAALVRLRRGVQGWPTYASLGFWLGLGYLAKTIMFPVGFLFLAALFLGGGPATRNWRRKLLAVAVFLTISGAYIALISQGRGRLTFGDAGTVTYLRHVHSLPYPHWQGDARAGTPLHPSRQIWDRPPIYEFASPAGGTYPISTDPYYWYEGASPPFHLAAQLRIVSASALFYLDLFVRQQGGLALALVLLLWLSLPPAHGLRSILTQSPLALIALATFALYALVHVEGRYVAVFVILFWADLLAAVHVPDNPPMRQIVPGLAILAGLFLFLNILAFNLEGAGALASGPAPLESEPVRAQPVETARLLHELHVRPGDAVAVIGYAFESYWARLARVRIVAEMLEREAGPFWRGDHSERQAVLETLAGTGARAIVAEAVPAGADLAGWHQVGRSSVYIHLLQREP